MKQTHGFKLVESLSPITKKLDKLNESTQKIEDVIKEKNTAQPAIGNTECILPIANEQVHPGLIYDTSLENT